MKNWFADWRSFKYLRIATLLAGCFLLAGASARANLLTNGGFEDPAFGDNAYHYVKLNGSALTGWTTSPTPVPGAPNQGTVLFNALYDLVSEGNQAVQIEDPGDWISQTIPTVVGRSYTLSFDLTAYSGYSTCPCVASLGVSVGPASVTVTGTSGSYATHTIQFTADASSTTVKFENPGVAGGVVNYPHIDKVSVTAAPESHTLTFQGVTFTTKLDGNVIDVEIDAEAPTGDWATAKYIDAIELSGIGAFSSFTMGGSGVSWTPTKANLSATGCKSGRGAKDACAQGTPLSLGENMHFTFTFDAGATLDDTAPVLTVRFLNAKMKKQGSMLAQPIPQVP